VGCFQGDPQVIHQPGHQRQLLGRADRAADADRVIGGGLLPGVDVFQGFGQEELLQRVIDRHLKAGTAELLYILQGQPGSVPQDLRVEGGIIPPVRSDTA